MNKKNLQNIAGSILDIVDSHCNLDSVDDYQALQNLIALIISEKLNLGIEFSDEECGL